MYGPFLTTRLSPTTPNDFIQLPSETDLEHIKPSDVKGVSCVSYSIEETLNVFADFSFDWSVRYFAMAPAKLSMAQSTDVSTGIWLKMNNDSQAAMMQDKEEFRGELKLG